MKRERERQQNVSLGYILAVEVIAMFYFLHFASMYIFKIFVNEPVLFFWEWQRSFVIFLFTLLLDTWFFLKELSV